MGLAGVVLSHRSHENRHQIFVGVGSVEVLDHDPLVGQRSDSVNLSTAGFVAAKILFFTSVQGERLRRRGDFYHYLTKDLRHTAQAVIRAEIQHAHGQFFAVALLAQVFMTRKDLDSIGSTDGLGAIMGEMETIVNGGGENRGPFFHLKTLA